MAKEFNHKVCLVPPKEMKDEIGSVAYHGGLVDEVSGGLNPAQYVAGLARAAEKAGVRLHSRARVDRIARGGKRFLIQTKRGSINADSVLVATAGYTGSVTKKLQRTVIPGQASSLFGESFLRDLSRRFGPQAVPKLTQVVAGHPLPYLDNLTARAVTGQSFHTLWQEWRQTTRESAFAEARVLQDRGLTPLRLLTTRGTRQTGPRFSPDGTWIAYTSRTLTRYREIRLIRPAGSEDHRLTLRNGGSGLAWTPDGRRLVYDESESYRFFRVRSDLRAVEVATGRVRRLTRGLRAREPDVARDGRRVVFVRLGAEGSELALVGLDGWNSHSGFFDGDLWPSEDRASHPARTRLGRSKSRRYRLPQKICGGGEDPGSSSGRRSDQVMAFHPRPTTRYT